MQYMLLHLGSSPYSSSRQTSSVPVQ
uniref:Uncharacterized protein n=1 Tax=Arundo donax TaxID=35708 RepID=A0A0A9G0E6_ARUDO